MQESIETTHTARAWAPAKLKDHTAIAKHFVAAPGNPLACARRSDSLRLAVAGALSRIAGCQGHDSQESKRDPVRHRFGEDDFGLSFWAHRRRPTAGGCFEFARGHRRAWFVHRSRHRFDCRGCEWRSIPDAEKLRLGISLRESIDGTYKWNTRDSNGHL